MPIFAQLFASIAMGFANFFVRWFTSNISMKLALYTTWMITFSAFLAAVYICINALYSTVAMFTVTSGLSWVRFFFVGLGMFIPANAGAVIACVSSVWIATAGYKIKKQGLFMASGTTTLV